jgi:hypothetical protein
MTTTAPEAELVPLATLTFELRAPIVLDPTPSGVRWIVEVESGRIDGKRLRADIDATHANADWFTVGPDQAGTVDARVLAETDDGAAVFLQYHGRVDLSSAGAPIYIAPRFETGAEQYRWLNTIQAVGKGALDGTTLTYQLYEIR